MTQKRTIKKARAFFSKRGLMALVIALVGIVVVDRFAVFNGVWAITWNRFVIGVIALAIFFEAVTGLLIIRGLLGKAPIRYLAWPFIITGGFLILI